MTNVKKNMIKWRLMCVLIHVWIVEIKKIEESDPKMLQQFSQQSLQQTVVEVDKKHQLALFWKSKKKNTAHISWGPFFYLSWEVTWALVDALKG